MDLASLLAELGNDLTVLSDEQLAELRASIRTQMEEVGNGELVPETIGLMQQAKEARIAIKAEQDARATAAAELVTAADDILNELADEDVPDAPEGETKADAPKADAPKAKKAKAEAASEDGETAAETEDETVDESESEDAETVTAAAPAKRAVRVPARHQPRETEDEIQPHLVASGSVRGVAVGHEFGTPEEAYRAIHDTWFALRGSIDGVDHNVLTIDYRHLYSEDKRMGADPWENAAKMEVAMQRHRKSLTAAGGIPGPGQPKYDLITYGSAARPLRDALPTFLAPRGIVNWNVSPTIDDFIVDTTGAAINRASSATDAAGGSYKTVQEVSAVTPATATVEAQYARLQHGNFADKFLPELMAAWMRNLQVRYARHNDARRLSEISAGSTHYTNVDSNWGAYRQLKRELINLVEEIEDHLRDPDLPIRVLMPMFVPSMLATDLIAQQPGDSVWNITEDAVMADMAKWDPRVTFTYLYDGPQTNQRNLTTPTGQSPRSPNWTGQVEWYAFPEGTWAFLDGGTLDLGIVRDSTLNAQNRFQTFTETWEVAAKFGPFSYHVTSSLCAGGDTQVATDINKCGPAGS